jgi:hypothetical protein
MAPRAGRYEPPVYFGAPGALVQLPWPRSGINTPYERQIFDFVTGSGGHRVSSLIGGSRQYGVNWDALHQTTFDKVNQYWLGTMGPGPFVFIDPSRPNMLSPNQSAASSVWNDTTGFGKFSDADGYITSNSNMTHVHRPGGTRSVRWNHTNSPAWTPFPGMLLKTEYPTWPGIPFVAGLPYTFSFWVKPMDDVGTSQVAAKIFWLDSTGAEISNTTSGDITVTGGVWTRLSVTTNSAPALPSMFMEARVLCVASTLTAGMSFYLDELMLEQSATLNDWAPGAGIQPVAMTNWQEDVPWVDAMFRVSPGLVLREVVG